MTPMTTACRFYGLLHLARGEESTMNDRGAAFDEQVDVYLTCAAGLADSLARSGLQFVLLTNAAATVSSRCEELRLSMKVEGLACTTRLPSGTPFFSAHFKWDAYAHFATVTDVAYVGLLDLDMVATGPLPPALAHAIDRQVPLCYEITDQVLPAYGPAVVLRDLRLLDPELLQARWYGGEFLCGPPGFFSGFAARLQPLLDSYVRHLDAFHHVSDEMLTSVVLGRMQQDGCGVMDAGAQQIVGRLWSVPTRHCQKPFGWFMQCFLLHLPADKRYLAATIRNRGSYGRDFRRRFRTYYRLRHARRMATRVRRVRDLLRRLAAAVRTRS